MSSSDAKDKDKIKMSSSDTKDKDKIKMPSSDTKDKDKIKMSNSDAKDKIKMSSSDAKDKDKDKIKMSSSDTKDEDKDKIKMSSSDAAAEPSVATDTVLRNLKGAMYKMSVQEMPSPVVCMAVSDCHLFVSLDAQGLFAYKIDGSEIKLLKRIESCNCFDVLASQKHLVYTTEDTKRSVVNVVVHSMSEVLSHSKTNSKPLSVIKTLRRAPLALHSDIGLLVIGGQAWMTTWTSSQPSNKCIAKEIKNMDESHVAVLEIDSTKIVTHWKAVNNCVALLRTQTQNGHQMLGVADTRTGLSVYELTCRDGDKYVRLFHVPVEEIRNFHLVGNEIAVFHKFEPNVSFWNMKEHRTILCINIQDQMKEMTEELFEADDDCGVVSDDGDHVTSVMSVLFQGEMTIVYGTMSGCVFGMSVARRSKCFNIPCPFVDEPGRKNALGVAFLPSGKLVIGYEKHGLVLMDFGYENPPSRPVTRCQKRTT